MHWNGIIILLSISLCANILFIWYLRQLLGRFGYVCKNIYDLKRTVDLYMAHLSVISELEMFYKDPNVEVLMQHTADLITQLKTYEEFYDLLAKDDVASIPSELKGTEDNDREESSAEAEEAPEI